VTAGTKVVTNGTKRVTLLKATFEREHVKLIRLLREGGREALLREATAQRQELAREKQR
jgi:F0F1-type ATP synthase delta subunit